MKRVLRLVDVSILEEMQGNLEEIAALVTLIRSANETGDRVVSMNLANVRNLVERLGEKVENTIDAAYSD